MLDLTTQLINIQNNDYCWSLGHTRLANFECRLYPKKYGEGPVMIVAGENFQDAVTKAIARFEREWQPPQ